ncbi:MAG: HlyC/CorC family transporter [Saprospiraceae bacterium]|nr:HlyC/CorC family transporter [Saprospiraceae bacterium]
MIIIILVLINGTFAMSELSLVSSRRFKLESAARKGSSRAKAALELSDNPIKFLSTVQIGITLISILLGVFSGETITKTIAEYLSNVEFIAPYSKQIGTGLSVIFITYLSIVLGELFPKRIGMTFPEPIAIFVAKPMQYLSTLTSPFVWLLTISNNLLLRIFAVRKSTDSKVSEEEIKAIVKESADGGEIQEIEHNIVERVFEMGDKRVSSLYTHRRDITYLNLTDDWATIKSKINSDKHSAYPVCIDNNLDEIKGILLLKDLFDDSGKHFDLSKVIKQPLFVIESLSAFKVLEKFKEEKMHYGIVIDEYGVTVGMVTMDDTLDALVGDSSEQGIEEYTIVQTDENTWLADGFYNITEFQKKFDLDLSAEVLEKYSTLAGLFIYHNENVPNIGDTLDIDNITLQIVDKDGQRIDKILITKNKDSKL